MPGESRWQWPLDVRRMAGSRPPPGSLGERGAEVQSCLGCLLVVVLLFLALALVGLVLNWIFTGYGPV
jgi:hypothetical protein